MNDLVMLVVTILTSIGLAILLLVLSEIVINTIPRLLMPKVNDNSALLAQDPQRSAEQNKGGSCPFCQP